MRRTTRHRYSVARCAVTALMGAVLVLLGGADAAGAVLWAAGSRCVTVQEVPATGTEPLRPVAPDSEECPEPAERRRGHGTVPFHPCAHRTGPVRATGCGQSPPPRAEAWAEGDPVGSARAVRPWPPRPGGTGPDNGGARVVVLRC